MKKFLLFTIAILAITASASANDKMKRTQVNATKHTTTEHTVAVTNAKEQLNGEWRIDSIDMRPVMASLRENNTLVFDFKRGMIYGNNGCNTINGKFKQNGNEVTFSSLEATEDPCENDAPDMLKLLSRVKSFTLVAGDDVERLLLFSTLRDNGSPVITMRRNNLSGLHNTWEVEEIFGEKETDIKTLIIDIEAQKVMSYTLGGNVLSGIIHIDHSKDRGVQFEQFVVTGNENDFTPAETKMLLALEETMSYRRLNDKEYLLLNKEGVTVMKIKTIPPRRIKK